MTRLNFRQRTLLFSATLVAMALAAAVLPMVSAVRTNIAGQLTQQTNLAAQLVNARLEERQRGFANAARVLARDYGFREAVAVGDAATIRSAARNMAGRIKADRLIVLDNQGRLVSDTSDTKVPLSPGALGDNVDEGTADGRVVDLGGQHYFVATAPIQAPDLIGRVVVANRIDRSLLEQLSTSLPDGTGLTYVSGIGGKHPRILASSLAEGASDGPELIRVAGSAGLVNVVRSRIASEEFLTRRVAAWPDAAGDPVQLLLHLSLDQAMLPFRHLWLFTAGLSTVVLLAAFAGSAMLARGLGAPLQELAAAADAIAEGDYAVDIKSSRDDEFGRLAQAFTHMATQIWEREATIRSQAQTDTLTGLPNRLFVETRLDVLLEQDSTYQEGLSVLLVAIDRFQEINNTLSHETGDQVIKMVALRLQNSLKASDTTARLSSDTFALVLPRVRLEDSITIARRTLALFEDAFVIDTVSVDINVCIGISSFPVHGETARTLLRMADRCVHTARNAAERYAVYDPAADSSSHARLGLMGELRRAIVENTLVVHYQPQVSLKTGDIIGAEALVRWPSGNGFISPGEFIPLAEQTGDIQRLTRWVLERSFAQVAEWRREYPHIGISINLSVRDLMNGQLPTSIAELLHRFAIEPAGICLEITESSMMKSPGQVFRVMRALARLGFDLAIDDFGTGYSSLAYLQQLSVHELKIDQSFIRDMATNDQSRSIVAATIDMAKSLGLRVVAEGVEDDVSRHLLRKLGCEIGQGYLFARPMPAGQFMELLAAQGDRQARDAGELPQTGSGGVGT